MYSQNKTQLILAKWDPITTLIIRDAHKLTLHGGPQNTLTALRRTYWIVSGRSAVRKLIAKCVTCIRDLAPRITQLMGDLSAQRVYMAPPFAGTNYAGPFEVRLTKTRGRGTVKCFITLFICMATRAVHLELVKDYTTESFIAAFHRFAARRGHFEDL